MPPRRSPTPWHGLAVLAMVVVTVDVLAHGPLRRLDQHVHRVCDRYVRGFWLDAVEVVTQFGQRGTLVQIMAPLAVAAAVRQRSLRCPLAALLVVVVLSALQLALKAPIPRTFPIGEKDLLFAGSDAYPSGHTLNAFVLIWVILELLAVVLPRFAGPRRRRAIALTTGVIGGVALVLADHHWLTDVLFSLALGPLLLAGLVAWSPFGGRSRPTERHGPGPHGADGPEPSRYA